MTATICFSHGKESGPWGTKITRLAQRARELGWPVESLDYRGMEVGAREARLAQWCALQATPPVLVGSSTGAHVALTQAAQAQALFLLAPAVYMPGYEHVTPPPPSVPTVIVHGWHDEVVPVDNAVRFARQARCTLHVLPDDHRLTGQLDEIVELFAMFLDSIKG